MSASTSLLANEAAIGRMLAQGILDGRWQLTDLDKPTPTWTAAEADRRTAIANATRRGYGVPFPPPATYRNLAREWIEANPKEWDQMLYAGLKTEEPALTVNSALMPVAA